MASAAAGRTATRWSASATSCRSGPPAGPSRGSPCGTTRAAGSARWPASPAFRYRGPDHRRDLLRAGGVRAAAGARGLRSGADRPEPVISLAAEAAQAAPPWPAGVGPAQWGAGTTACRRSLPVSPPRPPDPPPRRGGTRALRRAALAGTAALAVGGLHRQGSIAASTPASNGKSFVPGGPGATLYKTGARRPAPPVSGPLIGAEADAGRLPRPRRGPELLGLMVRAVPAGGPVAGGARQPLQGGRGPVPRRRHPGQPGQREAFLSNFRISYPSLNDPGDDIALAFRGTVPPAGIPTTLVIDRSGRIAARIVGGVPYNGLKTLISGQRRSPDDRP